MNIRIGAYSRFMLTFVLIAVNVIAYIYTSIVGGDFITTGWLPISLYGQVNYSVIYEGWYWQLFTAMFVHANIIHLLGNMLILFVFGLRAEELFSTREYLLIYFLSGLTGNLLTLTFGPSMVSAGASGAIFGLFGAVTIYVRRALGQSILGALVFSFFLLIISSGFGVNVLAHLGGLIVGLLIGYRLAMTRVLRPIHQYTYRFSGNA